LSSVAGPNYGPQLHPPDKEGDEEDEYLPHGAKIIKELVCPWWGNDWIVCADSYFASVVTAVKLKRIGLRFIGVVKSAMRIYPRHMVSLLPMYRNRKVCWTGRKAEGFLQCLSRGAG
jgi:hypothetical protein